LKTYLRQNKTILSILLFVIALGVISPIAGAVASLFFFILLLHKGDIQNLFLLFYLVLFFSDSRSGLFEFSKIIKPALAFFFGFIGLYIGIKRKLFPEWVKYFIPFFVWSLFVIYYSPIQLTALQKTISYIFLYLSVPVILILLLDRKGNGFLKNYFFIVFLLLFIGLGLKIIAPDMVTLAGRYRGLLGNPNGLGIFLTVQFLFFQVVISTWPRLFSKTELRWLYAIFILSLFLSRSRTALGVFLIFFVLKWIYKRSTFLGVFVSILIVSFGSFILALIPDMIVSFGLQDYLRIKTLEEGSGRVVAWTFAWFHIKENYFIGRGFGYTIYLFHEFKEMLAAMNHQGNAHNSYLTFWLNTGLIGLVLYFFALLRVIIKSAKVNKIAMPVFTGFLISANFESWLTASLNPFTIVFVMTITQLRWEPGEEVTNPDDQQS
jgi:O-antigen ligase